MTIAANYAFVMSRIEQAAKRAGRDPKEIQLIAVSKTVGVPEVEEAHAAGIVNFGENRPDMLMDKQAALPEATWHFIGNIQSRRIKDIIGRAALVHSVDRFSLFPHFESRCATAGVRQRVLLEVNVSGEQSKSGFAPQELDEALEQAASCEHLEVCGLMTMAPQGDLDIARKTFSGLRELRDTYAVKYQGTLELSELSMGMSEDYVPAVEEGATLVRVGRSIFQEGFAENHV